MLKISEEARKPFVAERDIIAEIDRHGVAMAGLIANVSAERGPRASCSRPMSTRSTRCCRRTRTAFSAGVASIRSAGSRRLRYIERAVKELGFIGVHVYPHWFGVPIDDRIYWPIYAKCCELGVPITLQVGRQSPRSGGKLVARPACSRKSLSTSRNSS